MTIDKKERERLIGSLHASHENRTTARVAKPRCWTGSGAPPFCIRYLSDKCLMTAWCDQSTPSVRQESVDLRACHQHVHRNGRKPDLQALFNYQWDELEATYGQISNIITLRHSPVYKAAYRISVSLSPP
ncbi:hypothetical protein RF11_06628 [Thelohanellus kitauei]|uniref:Uncharacterized protein n=1 Tax=Thelohanellus kitauei TaxID=669202 RepID=A0A0C2MSR4_THEKT|nr:hypothetical protein RF11_06628 [Thelohanellus kitauei]